MNSSCSVETPKSEPSKTLKDETKEITPLVGPALDSSDYYGEEMTMPILVEDMRKDPVLLNQTDYYDSQIDLAESLRSDKNDEQEMLNLPPRDKSTESKHHNK